MEKRKLISNSLAMLINRLVQSVSTFILSAAIARFLGAEALGQYLLAFSYYFLFVSIVSQGLKTFFIRELSRQPETIPAFLINGSILQIILAISGYGVLAALIFVLPYNVDTSTICYIMGLAILPFSLSNLTEAVFQAQERMHLIALSTVPVYILRLALQIVFMNQGSGVPIISKIFVLSEVLIFSIQLFLIVPNLQLKWCIDYEFMRCALVKARTFFAIEGMAIVQDRMQIFALSLFGSELLVGLYGGIIQLMQPVLIITHSIVQSAFPALSKSLETGREKQRQISEDVIELLLCITLPLIIGVLFFAKDLLIFVYSDPSFGEAELALQITALSLLAAPFKVLSYLTVVNGMERVNLIEVIVTTTLGGVSGIFLVPAYGLIGAVLMKVVMKLSALSQYSFAVWTRLFSLRLWKVFRRSLLISGLMALVFNWLRHSQLSFLFVLLISTALYCVATSILMALGFGIHQKIWARVMEGR